MKWAVISGASAGIGAATADALCQNGYSILGGARRFRNSENPSQYYLDVTDSASIEKFRRRAIELGAIAPRVLVVNAGLAQGVDPLHLGETRDWQTTLVTNVVGALEFVRAFLPAMREAGVGDIVFLSSIAAHQVYDGGAVYCASKHALRAIIDTLRLESCGTGLRIVSIDPGMVDTEFSLTRHKGDVEKSKNVYRGMRPLSAGDIADLIVYAVTRPAHVTIAQTLILPTDQASVGKVHRTNI